MKHFYEVLAQFAKAGAPSFQTKGFISLLDEAKTHFNTRSLVAANPKNITDIEIVDSLTIRISLWSQNELAPQQISRSLRVFSMYLIDEKHPLNFGNYVSGKRLFKMQAKQIVNNVGTGSLTGGDQENQKNTNDLSDQEALIAVVKLFFNENPDTRSKIILIKKVLGGKK